MKKNSLLAFMLTAGCALWSGYNAQAQLLIANNNRSQSSKLTQTKLVLLKEALSELEVKYKVSIAYQTTVVANRVAAIPDPGYSKVEDALKAVLEGHDLQYKKIKKHVYIVAPKPTPKKATLVSPIETNRAGEPASTESFTNSLESSEVVNETKAPDVTISGKVSSSTGEGLPGVSVLVKGTSQGTTTGTDGSYTLQVPEGNTTLVFSFIGYATKEVPVNNNTVINVTLAEDVQALKELVVIGYGERERKDVVGAVSAINAKEIEKSPFQSPQLAMQGRMPGVYISSPGGNPNARPVVRIRGIGTFGNAEPLYVVDGVPINEYGAGSDLTDGSAAAMQRDIRGSQNILNTINPNDIESISVLKDATAAAVYGVRASNGVILITTKKGKAGKPKVEVNASKGVQNIVKTFDMLNVQDYTALHQEMFANAGKADDLPAQFKPGDASYLGDRPNIDWQTPLLNKNARIEDYSVRFYGGNESTTYYFSGGYNFTESPLIKNNSERYTLAVGADSKVNKFIRTGITYRLSHLDALDNTRSNLQYFASAPPWQPIYDPNGPYGYAPSVAVTFTENIDPVTGKNKYDPTKLSTEPRFNMSNTRLYGPETNSNMYAHQALNETQYNLLRNMGSAYFQLEPIAGLKFKGNLMMDWSQNRRSSWEDVDTYLFSETPTNPYTVGYFGRSKGSYGERTSRNYTINKEFSVNYTKAFGQHNVDVLFLASDQRWRYDLNDISGSQNLSRDPLFRGVRNQPPYNGAAISNQNEALLGYLGRLSYNFASRYYLDVTVRRDGSSRFAEGYKWGTFPAASVAWRISGESFMQGMPFINDLKLRAGWGRLGNEKTRSFAFLSTIDGNPDYAFGSGNGDAVGIWTNGIRLADFPILNLSWETAQTTNVAFDASFLNNKITATVEYYHKIVRDILQAAPLAGSVGVENAPILNIATVKNTGMELQLGYNGQVGAFNYNVGGNLTTVKNRVLKTFKDQPFSDPRFENLRIEVGQPIGYLWGYKVGGIFQNQDEIDRWRETNSDNFNNNQFAPGDMYFQDVNTDPTEGGQQPTAGPDGKVNPNDRTYLGKTIPTYYYGINMGAGFKNFDLSLLFQGVADVQQYNHSRATLEQMNSQGVNQLATTRNRWTTTNPSTSMPRAVFEDPAQNNRFSSRFVENAGFLRLRNVQLGYTLPQSLKTRLGFVDNFRIYVTGLNLITITDYSGLDPEEAYSLEGGRATNNFVPNTRSFLVGINATF